MSFCYSFFRILILRAKNIRKVGIRYAIYILQTQHTIAERLQGGRFMQNYRCTWLDDDLMYWKLRRIAKIWPSNRELGLILYEVWSAMKSIAPFPHVCVLSSDNQSLAVLCGSVWSEQSCFSIHQIAIAPHEHKQEEIFQTLIKAAIDFSQDVGFHGWVSCDPEEGSESIWRQHGFDRHDDGFTFRRMGYFTRL